MWNLGLGLSHIRRRLLPKLMLIVNFEERAVQVFTYFRVAPERDEFPLLCAGEDRRPKCAL